MNRGNGGGRGFNHVEMRDDRVLLFADSLRAGIHTHRYLARALSSGVFGQPGTKAEQMYAPEVFGRSAERIGQNREVKKVARKLLAFGLVLCAGLVLSTLVPLPAGRLRPEPVVSFRILDRDGVLLREVLSDAGGRCRWVTLDDVSPFLIKATIAAEDRFFYFHRGVDGLSAMRAAWQNLRHGRVVSGASTISQQVVRNIYPGRRTIRTKLVQIMASAAAGADAAQKRHPGPVS